MKDELQGKLVEILTSIQMAAGKASDFAMEQLPDIAQSYVAYGRAVSVASVLASLLMLAAAFVGGWLAWRSCQRDWREQSVEVELAGTLMAILGGVGGSFALYFSVNKALLVWFAPKVWLLKEIAGLLK